MTKKMLTMVLLAMLFGGCNAGNPDPKSSRTAPVQVAAAGPHLETGENLLNEHRDKNLSPIPDAQADYVFSATLAKPAWEGMAGMRPMKDYFGAGADGMEFYGAQESTAPGYVRPSAMFWKMTDIAPGKYYMGMWLETQDTRLDPAICPEYGMNRLLGSLYLNGWPVRFSTTSEPVQVKPGIWLAELQTADAVKLKPGDEIAFRQRWPATTYLRLALHRSEPKRGHGVTGRDFGMWGIYCFPRLRLSLQTDISGSGEAGTPHEARIIVANPLPYAADAVADWKLEDYFGKLIAGKTEAIHLEPHAVKTIVHRFTADAEAQAYQLDVKTHATEGFHLPVPRPLDMIELNDWTKLEFLPNLPGPMEAWQHTRKDLRTDNVGGRRFLCLDGDDWERGPLAGRRVPQTVPADIKYGRVRVPVDGRAVLPKGVFGMWYHKKFRVPEWLKGETFQLELKSVAHEGTVFLNGQRVAERCLEFYPRYIDVTKALKPDAENDLAILVRGGVGLVKDSFVDQYDLSVETDPHEDFPGYDCNEATLGSVWLRTLPAVHVRQTLVIPDVEQKDLLVLSRVKNLRDVPCTVELRYEVSQDGKVVADAVIPLQTVSLKPGEMVEVRAQGTGKGLQHYTPADPVLAKLTTSIVEKGAVDDVQEQRFGYRTVKLKGAHLMLNGQPFFTFSYGAMGGAQEMLEGENGVTTFRCDNIGPDFADEIGQMYYPVVTWSAVDSWEKLNNDKFWERDQASAVEYVWSYGSHPTCIGCWRLHNEDYCFAVYKVGLEGQAKGGERYFSIAQAIRQRIWPDYWFMSDGNFSLGHRLKLTSWHYLNNGNWGTTYSATPRGFRDALNGTGVSCYAPDCFFLDGAASPPRPDTVVHANSAGADDWKPGMACANTEEYWFTDTSNGPAICKYIGDKAAVSPAWQYYTGRGMWWTRLSMQGYRDMENAIQSFYSVNFLNVSAQSVTFYLPQQEIRYYGGATFDKRLNIHDDEFAPGKLEFAWKLVAPDGKVCEQKTLNMESTTSYLKRDHIEFKVPEVRQRTQFILDMELSKNGKLREHERRIVEAWPAGDVSSKAVAPAEPVALFDPKGKTQAVLEKFGCKVKPITELTSESLAGSRCLIVGPDCVARSMPAEQQTIRQFAETGGRVLVLPQHEAGLLPITTYIEGLGYSSMGFVNTQDHPVMRGLTDSDFAMWNSGHLIARGLYAEPGKGNFLSLVDCGHVNLAWTPLFEIYLGKGSIVATQLLLLDNLETEPMVAEMWRRLLGYLAGKVYHTPPTAELAVLEGASEPVLDRLKELRADFEMVKALDKKDSVSLVELNRKDFSAQTEAFRQYVQNGGTLILHRAQPEHQEWLSALTGRKIAVEIQPYRSWMDRQMLEKRDGLAEGLNNLDFYWRQNVGWEGWDSAHQVSAGVAKGKGQVEYIVKVENAPDYLFPGGWVEVPFGKGKGRFIIDQLKWELPENKDYYGSPVRVASMMLSNLGVLQKPPAPKPVLPAQQLQYEPIDLGALVNRSLRDDVSGDGVGWVGWGPSQDLRDFTTGDINLGGVLFHVTPGEKNAVVLRSGWAKALAKYPESVTIPVGKKNVAGLYFLSTGGWTGGLNVYGWHEIHYADGTKESIGLNTTNFGDWNYGKDQFPDEENTTTTVAWRGTCKVYPVTRVYMTLWVNPHPEKEITDVAFTTKGLPLSECRFLADLGVTAAVLSEKTAAVARDARKSQALLQAALTLRQAKKSTEAAARLEEALKADDQNVGAWVAMTEPRAQTDTVEAFRALCQRWFQAMPRNYQAHNVLGAYLEAKGKAAEALVEYKRSLELEWNQPPAIQAVERLEKELGLRK